MHKAFDKRRSAIKSLVRSSFYYLSMQFLDGTFQKTTKQATAPSSMTFATADWAVGSPLSLPMKSTMRAIWDVVLPRVSALYLHHHGDGDTRVQKPKRATSDDLDDDIAAAVPSSPLLEVMKVSMPYRAGRRSIRHRRCSSRSRRIWSWRVAGLERSRHNLLVRLLYLLPWK